MCVILAVAICMDGSSDNSFNFLPSDLFRSFDFRSSDLRSLKAAAPSDVESRIDCKLGAEGER